MQRLRPPQRRLRGRLIYRVIRRWSSDAKKGLVFKEQFDKNLVTSHRLDLLGLQESTDYFYTVISTNKETAQFEGSFRTLVNNSCGKAYDITITSINPSKVQVGTNIVLTVSFTSAVPYSFKNINSRSYGNQMILIQMRFDREDARLDHL